MVLHFSTHTGHTLRAASTLQRKWVALSAKLLASMGSRQCACCPCPTSPERICFRAALTPGMLRSRYFRCYPLARTFVMYVDSGCPEDQWSCRISVAEETITGRTAPVCPVKYPANPDNLWTHPAKQLLCDDLVAGKPIDSCGFPEDLNIMEMDEDCSFGLGKGLEDIPASNWANSNIADWDVSRFTTMVSLFSWATNFNEDISRWDVSQVTSMIVRCAHTVP